MFIQGIKQFGTLLLGNNNVEASLLLGVAEQVINSYVLDYLVS